MKRKVLTLFIVPFILCLTLCCTQVRRVGGTIADTAEIPFKKMDDASITAAVKMRLANDDLVKASDINVDTKAGVVTLTGEVEYKELEKRAIELALSVAGVKQVISKIEIKSE